MRLRLFAWLAFVFVSLAGLAYGATYLAYEQITVADTVIGFTAAKITPPGQAQATMATCNLETAEIRYTVDGVTTPSTTVGMLLAIADPLLVLTDHDVLVNFRAIRTTGSSGLLTCSYSRP